MSFYILYIVCVCIYYPKLGSSLCVALRPFDIFDIFDILPFVLSKFARSILHMFATS